MVVAETIAKKTGKEREYWTADEELVKKVAEEKRYVKLLAKLFLLDYQLYKCSGIWSITTGKGGKN